MTMTRSHPEGAYANTILPNHHLPHHQGQPHGVFEDFACQSRQPSFHPDDNKSCVLSGLDRASKQTLGPQFYIFLAVTSEKATAKVEHQPCAANRPLVCRHRLDPTLLSSWRRPPSTFLQLKAGHSAISILVILVHGHHMGTRQGLHVILSHLDSFILTSSILISVPFLICYYYSQ